MRRDQLYGPGGFDPDHSSNNVLDEFVHDDPDDPTKGVTVLHYNSSGETIIDRPLTTEEVSTFFEPGFASDDDRMALTELADTSITERLTES